MSETPKAVPHFSSESEERSFWEAHDSTDHIDWSQAEKVGLPGVKLSSPSFSLPLVDKSRAPAENKQRRGR